MYLSEFVISVLHSQDPDGEIENSGKNIFEIRMTNFCYIQVIVFDFSYQCFSHFFMVADLLCPNRCNWEIAKVKNYNLNVTEVRHPDFKNIFPGIFNFTVGILFIQQSRKIQTNIKGHGEIRPIIRFFDITHELLSLQLVESHKMSKSFNLTQPYTSSGVQRE